MFAEKQSKRWIDFLSDVLTNYNNSVHGTTKHTPTALVDEKISTETLKSAQQNIKSAAKKNLSYVSSFKDDIEVGDYVRVSLYTSEDAIKNKLSKRNLNPTYSAAVYKVKKVIRPRERENTVIQPIKYRLEGLEGLFYRFRLQKTVAPDKQQGSVAKDTNKDLERDDDVDDKKQEEEVLQPSEVAVVAPADEVLRGVRQPKPKAKRKKQVVHEQPGKEYTTSGRQRKYNRKFDDYA